MTRKIIKIKTLHGTIDLPAFMPDATYGSINSISFEDAKNSGVKEIVTTTLHIEQKLGSDFLTKIGGFHKFIGWNRPILSDSGGFQVFSLIYASNIEENKITDEGCIFKNKTSGKTFKLTPESSQQIQYKIGADICTVLDEPTYGHKSKTELIKAVNRTCDWARRSKQEFLKLHHLTKKDFEQTTGEERPLLFAVVQGGNDLKLRKYCFEELENIGFDGYNWGGSPYDEIDKRDEVGEYLASLIPENKVAYAMGVGTPDDIVKCLKWGWNLFDCVLPTRNARHGYLYVTKGVGDTNFENYSVLRIKKSDYEFDEKPIDNNCDCEACRNYSRAYLRYLMKIKELAGFRLATIHNLRFYTKLLGNLRKKNIM